MNAPAFPALYFQRAFVGSLLFCFACGGQGGATPTPPAPSVLKFAYTKDDSLRLNHLQMKATHNSYHIRPADPIPEWDYSHEPLAVQLEEQGVRGFELDIHYKPDEDRFAVYHLPGDDNTTCYWLEECLQQLLDWSNAHRGHHPLMVLIEPKDDVEPFSSRTVGHFDRFDEIILSVWPKERILRPDDVKRDRATLAAGVRELGWPTLGELRGKILFIILDNDRKKDLPHYEYTHGLKDLNGRVAFIASEPADPYAAVMLLDNPLDNAEAIRKAADDGFLIRTWSDDPVKDGQATSTARLHAGLSSGAHMISSDYPVAGLIEGYFQDLTGGTPSRCNPQTAPVDCLAEDIESPARLQPLP